MTMQVSLKELQVLNYQTMLALEVISLYLELKPVEFILVMVMFTAVL